METLEFSTKIQEILVNQGEISQTFIDEVQPIQRIKKVLVKLNNKVNISLPVPLNDNDKQVLIGVAILCYRYEIAESDVVEFYQLYLNKTEDTFTKFEDIDINAFLIESISLLIRNFYNHYSENDLSEYENLLEEEVNKWNRFFIEEKVFEKSRCKTISSIAEEISCSEELINEIMRNRNERVFRTILTNHQRLICKLERLIISYPQKVKGQIEVARFILKEIKNGGANINSLDDLFADHILIKGFDKN